MRRLTKKHQNNDFYCTKSNFLYLWTCQFVKFESKRSFKLRKLQLSKEISNDICKVIFNVCLCGLIASNDWTITKC